MSLGSQSLALLPGLSDSSFTLAPVSCRRFQLTRDALLQVLGHRTLLEDRSTEMLQQKIALRATYVTPCNLIQVGCWLL